MKLSLSFAALAFAALNGVSADEGYGTVAPNPYQTEPVPNPYQTEPAPNPYQTEPASNPYQTEPA
ncbi:hypothetical protein GGI11_007947, partial [Coemansia sp. RSA 2049]